MNTSFALSAFQWRGVWGERTNSTPGRGYCANLGHPEDETGLIYMRARYYEPGTGRFISEDPARDGVNWYLYADGDAVNKVDVSGRNATKEFLWWLVVDLLFGKILPFIPKNSPYTRLLDSVLSNLLDAYTASRAILAAGSLTDPKVRAAAVGFSVVLTAAFLAITAHQLIVLQLLIIMDVAGACDHWLYGEWSNQAGFQIAPGWGLGD